MNLAKRLDAEVIKTLGLIMNQEDAEYTYKKNPKAVIGSLDCRICLNLFSLNALNQAKKWLSLGDNAVKEGIEIQRSTLRRFEYVFKIRGCNRLSNRAIDEMSIVTQKAYEQVSVFKEFLGDRPVTPEVVSRIDEVLNSTSFDENINANAGNGKMLLDCLKNAYVDSTHGGIRFVEE